MSNLKRSRPDQQDAVLRRLQEISSSRLEPEGKDDCSLTTSAGTANSSEDICKASNMAADVPLSIPHTHRDTTGNGSKEDTNPPLMNNDASTLHTSIPDLKITSEKDDSSSNTTVSSNSSSPKLMTKNPCRLKGINPLSVSTTPGRYSPQPSPPRLRATPPYSPKLCGRFENWPDSGPASSSPTSPSMKYFKLLNAPNMFAGGVRRGSEPLLDGISGRDLNEVKLSMTDRRWEKLRSILVAMKNEPFDVNTVVDLSSPAILSNLKENIDTQEELGALRKEISTLHTEMESKDYELEQALNERNVALAYIRKLKLNDNDLKNDNQADLMGKDKSTDLDLNHNKLENKADKEQTNDVGEKRSTDGGCRVYEEELNMLKKDTSTKDHAINLLEHVVEELRVERSYLNHLMSVVLERAPWMLDEVDKGGHWTELTEYGGRDEDKWTCSSDDEVWC